MVSPQVSRLFLQCCFIVAIADTVTGSFVSKHLHHTYHWKGEFRSVQGPDVLDVCVCRMRLQMTTVRYPAAIPPSVLGPLQPSLSSCPLYSWWWPGYSMPTKTHRVSQASGWLRWVQTAATSHQCKEPFLKISANSTILATLQGINFALHSNVVTVCCSDAANLRAQDLVIWHAQNN